MALNAALKQLIATKLAHTRRPQCELPIPEVRRAFRELWTPAITGEPVAIDRVEDLTLPAPDAAVPAGLRPDRRAAPSRDAVFSWRQQSGRGLTRRIWAERRAPSSRAAKVQVGISPRSRACASGRTRASRRFSPTTVRTSAGTDHRRRIRHAARRGASVRRAVERNGGRVLLHWCGRHGARLPADPRHGPGCAARDRGNRAR